MSHPLETYAVVGDAETAALVCSTGSVDWLCLPRFDHGACFAALLGDDDNGHWTLRPTGDVAETRRRYREGSLILETEFDTADGTIRLVDLMPPRGTTRGHNPDLVRIVQGVRGRVEVGMELVIRFDYGSIVPWVTRTEHGLVAIGGPDALTLTSPVEIEGHDQRTVATFEVAEGDEIPFVLTWHPSYEPPPEPVSAATAIEQTERWWADWQASATYDGPYPDAVNESFRVLKALTYGPTGGIVAAPTTSLPEQIGGVRNWDYRFSWLRDATFTLLALLRGGSHSEAVAWRDWLLRAVAGDPDQLQIMYGIAGERRLPEIELPWLSGYEGSTPVRVGNAAYSQNQVDIYGEVMDALHMARRAGMEPDEQAWEIQRVFLDRLCDRWDQPDHGIWEIRGEPQHFTHSKVMAWVAFDRGVKAVEDLGLDGPVDAWRELREHIHAAVCEHGYDPERNTFTQTYDGSHVDASLLLIPQVGFLHPSDPRVAGTIDAVEADLVIDDIFVARYSTGTGIDGLPGHEGHFLLCSFWLVDALAMVGRVEEARERFERLLELRNDVGLLSEEYDPHGRRMLGNFPQAFSHIGLINSACNLGGVGPAEERSAGGPAEQRSDGGT